MRVEALFGRFLVWRLRRVSNRTFVLIVSALVGLTAGLMSVALRVAVRYTQELLHLNFYQRLGPYRFLFAALGILITVLLAHLVFRERRPLGQGITDVLYAVSRRSSVLSPARIFSRPVLGFFTVGFGGSAGLEAPSLVSGAAIGSNLARLLHLGYKNRTLMVGCGTAGALSAIFNAPIAAVIFSIEVILTEVTTAAFIPLLIASVSATLVSSSLLGKEALFAFRIQEDFAALDLPFFLLLGALGGLLSLVLTRLNGSIEQRVRRLTNPYVRAVVGSTLLGALLFFFPGAFGEGYTLLEGLLNGNQQFAQPNNLLVRTIDSAWLLAGFMFLLIFAKIVATSLTLGAGGGGGIFGPTLVVGGLFGFVFARLANLLAPVLALSEANYALVGMCSLMSGVQYAPLTAIFMIAEMTGGYTLFVPLMLVSAVSYVTASQFERHSIYVKRLIQRGDLVLHNRDQQVLRFISIRKLVEKDLLTVTPDATLGELVALVRRSRRNIFPVVDAQRQFLGIITLDDIRDIMFDTEQQRHTRVRELMHTAPAEVGPDEGMSVAMSKFERTGAWNLPVTDGGRYIGFLSKSRIFNAYRNQLIYQNRPEL